MDFGRDFGRKHKNTQQVVVNGTHIQLPGDEYNPAYFVKVLEEREQVMYDYIGNGRYTSKEVLPVLDPARDYDKYPMKGVVNSRYGNIFSSEEVLSWDSVFFKFENPPEFLTLKRVECLNFCYNEKRTFSL